MNALARCGRAAAVALFCAGLAFLVLPACGGGDDGNRCISCGHDGDCPDGWTCQLHSVIGAPTNICAPEGVSDHQCEILFPS